MTFKERMRRRQTRAVAVDGETLTVTALSARDWVTFSDALARGPDGKTDGLDFLVRLVVATTRGPDGAAAFTEADVAWLKDEADVGPLRQLFDTACALNGIGTAEEARVKN